MFYDWWIGLEEKHREGTTSGAVNSTGTGAEALCQQPELWAGLLESGAFSQAFSLAFGMGLA